ncbi:MAG: AAA family ATPase, partial [Armatimonadetes bacterium]|nr:AAA family ATPase [Armatimonadota bacterium]
MYLKKLILRGFKSFSDKIELEFSPGITVIVGPNGGGKSNLMDALRFCLGEQSSRILRGNKTEEFIFNGSKFKKPLGMAEASVLFDNSQKILPLEFEEVLITRQIFREGYNQHFINKTSCRLRDIQELLMGTGIGQGGLCFLSQNEVEKVLLGSLDRREILEEISATNKYKFKKKESLRKLEQTNNNLIRLKDIILELSGQLKNLEGQLQKFRRYKHSCEKLKELEEIYFSLELKKNEEKYLPLKKEEEKIKLSESNLNLEINQARNEYLENKSLFLEIERQIELEHHDVNLFYLETQKQEDFLTLIEERKENISQNLNELRKEEENLKIKIKN